MPAKFFTSLEEKLGIIVACGPALRQLLAYRIRTGTFLPKRALRQQPNEDFVKMRGRINLRDIFWYRKATTKRGRVVDARPIFQSKAAEMLPSSSEPSPPPKTENDNVAPEAKLSVLDMWQQRIKNLFSSRPLESNSGSKDPTVTSDAKGGVRRKLFALPLLLGSTQWNLSPGVPSSDREHLAGTKNTVSATDTSVSKREGRRIAEHYRKWGLMPWRHGQREESNNVAATNRSLPTQDPFLQSDSTAIGQSFDHDSDKEIEIERCRDSTLMEILSHPVESRGGTVVRTRRGEIGEVDHAGNRRSNYSG